MTDNIKHIIMDLDHVTVCSNNSKKIIDFDDWTPTLIKRGFEDLIDQFLTWVDDPQASKESLEMSLRCHEVCEYLVMEYEQ